MWGHAISPVHIRDSRKGASQAGRGWCAWHRGCPPALPAQLQAFVSTLHFPAVGSTLPRMTNNFRPPQPLHGRKVFASRAATASGGSPHRVPHQLLSPLLFLALLGPSLPTP